MKNMESGLFFLKAIVSVDCLKKKLHLKQENYSPFLNQQLELV